MAATLALLQGPTKNAVASLSITAVGLGSTVLALTPSDALCFTYRQPYDDDVFKVPPLLKHMYFIHLDLILKLKYLHVLQSELGGKDIPQAISAPYDVVSAASSPYSKKLRPIGSKAFSRLTSPRTLTLTYGRNVALSSLIAINKYLFDLIEAEETVAALGEEPIYPEFPKKELKIAVAVGSRNAMLDWCTQMLRSLLDWAADVYLSVGLSRRIRKDVKASALRKGHYPFYSRLPRVIRTSLFSEATHYVAEWVVACCIEAYLVIAAMRMDPLPSRHFFTKKRLQVLALRCSVQAGRCTAAWIAVSLGSGIGSTAPQKFRGLSIVVCVQLAGLGTNMFATAFMARLLAIDGGGGGGYGGAAVALPLPPVVGPLPGDVVMVDDDAVVEPVVGEAAVNVVAGILDVDGGDVGPPPPLPPVHEARRGGGVVGVPRLPARRPRRPEVAPAAGPLAAVPPQPAGPNTPQAARDPPRAVAEERVEGDQVQEVAAVEEEEEEGGDGEDFPAEGLEIGLPPQTPPATANDPGTRE